MISVKLARVRIGRDGRISPTLLNLEQEQTRLLAETMTGVMELAVGRTRDELEEELEGLVRGASVPKVAKGMVEVILKATEFESPRGPEPTVLRDAVFKASARAFPVGTLEGMTSRDEVLREAAQELGLEPSQVEEALFLDLKGEQKVISWEGWTPAELVNRYNVGLIQGILLRAREFEVTLGNPSPARVRQLIGYLRFCQLLHEVIVGEEEIRFRVDGPLSVLEHERRYGLQMARFYPALLLQEQWSARVQISWPQTRAPLVLELGPDPRLVSWYPDRGLWTSTEIEELVERFNRLDSGVQASSASELHSLGDQQLFVPDINLRHEQGGELGLEVLGPARHRGLEQHLSRFLTHGPAAAMICVVKPPKKLRGMVMDAEKASAGRILYCSRGVPVKAVVDYLCRLRTRGMERMSSL